MNTFVLEVSGQVQSVGFRPFVYQLARAMNLTGCVYNDGVGAVIELEASAEMLKAFLKRLHSELPLVARIDQIDVCEQITQDKTLPYPFEIKTTQANTVTAQVMPDLAICDCCLHELFTPENPRYRYPLINCTYCGPRYSIIRQLPYDRAQTTMADFPLCERCAEDYQDPTNRRFHAQPIACERCGPQVSLKNAKGEDVRGSDPLETSAGLLKNGAIIAMKGIGGYHLVCDAQNEQAVATLRARKNRPTKPLAVMALNLASLSHIVQLTPPAESLLTSSQAPLTVLHGKSNQPLADNIAPNLNRLGVMLPYTPMQYLLLHACLGSPTGTQWLQHAADCYLVMTSANASGMPIVFEDEHALEALAGIADYFLVHERKIHMRNDDAIVDASGREQVTIRRGRGMAPDSIALLQPGGSVLATGADLKNTLSLSRQSNAFLSQYIGDLTNRENREYHQRTAEHLQSILNIRLDAHACDAHPDFFSRHTAENNALQQGLLLFKVQHHHAHAASVMVEHQLRGPTLAVVLDGLGLSEQGELWGGELLILPRISSYQRLGMFAPLRLPGGDKAAKQGWRIAAGFLHAQKRWHKAVALYAEGQPEFSTLKQMLDKNINTPLTSSAGRLFDCAAALLNISIENTFESESAMRLQAESETFLLKYPQKLNQETLADFYQLSSEGVLDFSALLLELLNREAQEGAALFHLCLIDAMTAWVQRYCEHFECKQVVLSGGVWLNQLLLDGVFDSLKAKAIMVYTNRQTPMNDGNISLGQLAVAQAKLSETSMKL